MQIVCLSAERQAEVLKSKKYIFSSYGTLAPITKTCLYNFDSLKPQFYISKTEVYRVIHYFFFLFLLENIDCGYSLETPH